jgi:hypothetical protein
MLHGRLARDGWRRFRLTYPDATRPLTVVETFARMEDLKRAFAEVAAFLRAEDAA